MSDLEFYGAVGARIRTLRQASRGGRGMTQAELAAALGVPRNTVSRWETATYRPGLEELDRVARILRVPLVALFPPQEEGAQEEGARERLAELGQLAPLLSDDALEDLLRCARELLNRSSASP